MSIVKLHAKRTVFGAAALAFALMLAAAPVQAGEVYVGLGLGLAGDEIGVTAAGVTHPTRCDSMLYSDPASAPMDAACTDRTPRRMFSDTFDLGEAFSGALSLGYQWNRWRLEAEFLASSHDGDTRPAIADTGNAALVGKDSEWSALSPPFFRVSNFKSRQLFVNLYYAFGDSAVWTPYAGIGAGFARVNADILVSYLRRTVADGYVAAAGGDPMQPEEWQLAAAGSESRLDADLRDNAFGYQIAAGLERKLAEKTSAFLTLRWSSFGEVSESHLWSTIRSHAPVQADGTTPFTTVQTFDDLGGITATAGIRYRF